LDESIKRWGGARQSAYLEGVPIKARCVVDELDLPAVVPVGEQREEDLAVKISIGDVARLDPDLKPQGQQPKVWHATDSQGRSKWVIQMSLNSFTELEAPFQY
jgi:hypothetical protein